MGKRSTHVLDVTQRKPGAGVRIELYVLQNGNITCSKPLSPWAYSTYRESRFYSGKQARQARLNRAQGQ